MDGATLQDRISRGLGAAARHIGASFDAYRPAGANQPLAAENRFLRLQAAFNAEDGKFARPQSYGRAAWWGVFDTAYTRPGDYLRGVAGIWFIAAQQHLLPPLCVQTNRTITLLRPAAPGVAGLNSYGGVQPAAATPLLLAWPASILAAGTAHGGELPGDASTANLTVLLPALPVTPRSADLITDDQARTLVVISAEQSDLGWRLTARQAAA